MMKFEINENYLARSVCDSNCNFTIKVLSRTDKTITYMYEGNKRRSKIQFDNENNEFIVPDNYSMAPVFRAGRKLTA